jgi:hypothetical protein
MPSPSTRGYIYTVLLAIIPVLVIYGLLAPEQVMVWTNLAAAVLGIPAIALARANVPPTIPDLPVKPVPGNDGTA